MLVNVVWVCSMFMHVKAISGVYYKRLLFTVLVIVVLAVVCYELTMNNGGDGGGSVFLEGVAYVEDESALKVAVDEAPSNMSAVVIALNNDISLKETLTIPIDKNITLISNRVTGFYRLIGPKSVATIDKPSSGLHVPGLVSSSGPTIVVETGGVLTLDGIIVTHVRDCDGSGVIVSSGGTLIMVNGEISGNTVDKYGGGGGGVTISAEGVFEFVGGVISGNTAWGGGVYNSGVFKLLGGKISGNVANGLEGGGGVFNVGVFSMLGGEIINNAAAPGFPVTWGFGGGVYNTGTFDMLGGTIANNTDNFFLDNYNNLYNSGTFNKTGGTIDGW